MITKLEGNCYRIPRADLVDLVGDEVAGMVEFCAENGASIEIGRDSLLQNKAIRCIASDMFFAGLFSGITAIIAIYIAVWVVTNLW